MDIDSVLLWGSLITLLVSKDVITFGIWCRLQDDNERKMIFYMRYGWTMVIYGFVTLMVVPIGGDGGKPFLFIYSFFLFIIGSVCVWWLSDIANCGTSEHVNANGTVITNLDELDTGETQPKSSDCE